MKGAVWSFFLLATGIIIIFLIKTFQDITVNRDHDYYLLKEITASAMFESVDILEYRLTGEIHLDRDLFRQSFYRRFAETTMSSDNTVEFYEINEYPPKVSVAIVNNVGFSIPFVTNGDRDSVTLKTRVDQILQTKY